ncbi:MAG: sucrase ferredoxin [Nocardioidaceae bacterium]
MTDSFRCSVSSLARGESSAGTASTVRAFLLIEFAGPWGADALRDARLPPSVKQRLADLTAQHRVRPLLIRKHGRGSNSFSIQVFAANSDPENPWLQTATVDKPEDLLDLDLAALGAGDSPGLDPHQQPLFLVCTHGRHDVCCAERGRPVAAALSRSHPNASWEVSHIGGDRFAANLLVLPDGLYYGRLDPETAQSLAAAHLGGHLDLERLRGRCGYPTAVQIAELHLRRELGLSALRALRLRSCSRSEDIYQVVFLARGQSWLVRIRTSKGPVEQLACRARRLNPTVAHQVLGIELTLP